MRATREAPPPADPTTNREVRSTSDAVILLDPLAAKGEARGTTGSYAKLRHISLNFTIDILPRDKELTFARQNLVLPIQLHCAFGRES